jgi:PAS domain S-box-containing protein
MDERVQDALNFVPGAHWTPFFFWPVTSKSPKDPHNSSSNSPHAPAQPGWTETHPIHVSGRTYANADLHSLLVRSVRDYAIFALDAQGHVVSWNEGAQRIKGYSAKEIIGKHFSAFYPEEDLAWDKPAYELEVAAREGRFEDEGWRLRKDGTRFWANVIITALRSEEGELVGFAKVTRDLTERRHATEKALADARRIAAEEAARTTAEERAAKLADLAAQLEQRTREIEEVNRELEYQIAESEAMSQELEQTNMQLHETMIEAEEARVTAEHANRVKGDFLAAMSHELRTPLNAIGGYTDLLMLGLRGPVTPDQRQDLERIRRSQQHLLRIINDILNFSRVEAGYLTYHLGRVPIGEVAENVSTMIVPQAATKGIHYEQLTCPPTAIALADRPKVEQILLNLLSNAVKFTPPRGRVTLTCEADDMHVVLRITDTGPGISPDQLETIFEPFVQVGRSLTQFSDGTGLGLAISQDLAQGMQGNITVESKVGVGSTFTLQLPRMRDESESP